MQTKLLSDDSHQHVNGDSDPNRSFDHILGGAIEGLDWEMRFFGKSITHRPFAIEIVKTHNRSCKLIWWASNTCC